MSVIGERGRDLQLHGFSGGGEFCLHVSDVATSNYSSDIVIHLVLVILVISQSSRYRDCQLE